MKDLVIAVLSALTVIQLDIWTATPMQMVALAISTFCIVYSMLYAERRANEKSIVLIAILLIVFAEPVKAERATAYCLTSPRCDGGATRLGICAMNSHYGEVAMVYENDNGMPGEFLGYLEVLDHCPSAGVIDVWIPGYTNAMRYGNHDVIVYFVKGDG